MLEIVIALAVGLLMLGLQYITELVSGFLSRNPDKVEAGSAPRRYRDE